MLPSISRAEAGIQTDDHQQRADHFAQEHAIGEKGRQPHAGQHAADTVDAMQQFVDAMQQHQYADREPENEFACIVCHLRASQLRRRESAALTPM